MKTTASSLPLILARSEGRAPPLETLKADDAKTAARFWFGTTASNKMRKDECIAALVDLFKDRKKVAERLETLPPAQKQILSVFKRYGGFMSRSLLLSELFARKLVDDPHEKRSYSYQRQTDDPVYKLAATLLLVSRSGSALGSGHYYSGHGNPYSDMGLHPAIRDLVEPGPPLNWQQQPVAKSPTETFRRSPAEVALDLCTVASALEQLGSWKTNKGGSLAKSAQAKLKKALPGDEKDPLLPPAPESLYYEILRGGNVVEAEDGEGRIVPEAARDLLQTPEARQAWYWVRTWIRADLWQDGIGVVPDRDNHSEPVRIEPGNLESARELVVWGLCRIAQGPSGWLDLETFLLALWSETAQTIGFYWESYTWDPRFESARGKDQEREFSQRSRAFWMDREGTWAANAIMVTLVHLGLVERGVVSKGRPSCFRLTRLGLAVFGAPDREPAPAESAPKFLTVQPNFEVQVYLDEADPSKVWPLAQMGRRASSAGPHVQTFALTRDSVYSALEQGLTQEAILAFLTEHSRTGLPENVARSLREWGGKREALVLRFHSTLAVFPPGSGKPFEDIAKARKVGDSSVLLPGSEVRGLGRHRVIDHDEYAAQAWEVNAQGQVSVEKDADLIAVVRLSQFADREEGGWKITAESVRRARERGITAEQILGWMEQHLSRPLPAVMETAIRNWASPASVFLDNLLMLQIRHPQATAMILANERFTPLLAGHIPPNWFIVLPEKRQELEALLKEVGFNLGGPYRLAPQAEEGEAEEKPSGRRKGRRKK